VTLSVKLSAAPELPAREPVKIQGNSPLAGLTAINLSPAVTEEFSVEGVSEGVVVSDIDDDSPAAAVNFRKGDVILAINDAKIASTKDLDKATGGKRYYWKLTIGRGGQVITTVLGG
jgi:S1-C subfamily serine protease